MKVEKRKGERRGVTGYLLSVAVCLLMAAAFAAASLSLARSAGARGEEALRRSVTRASVLCYAIEGRYPPSVDYLEANYGVAIDRERYHVFYSGFASNVMPEITIVPIQEQGGR